MSAAATVSAPTSVVRSVCTTPASPSEPAEPAEPAMPAIESLGESLGESVSESVGESLIMHKLRAADTARTVQMYSSTLYVGKHPPLLSICIDDYSREISDVDADCSAAVSYATTVQTGLLCSQPARRSQQRRRPHDHGRG
eukprot:COSAG01_NODE_16584_length_1223_cov_2.925267_3_plen_141_part_00